MKNLLIIYPHWPPSNLAGMHRPRLIANNIGEYGWRPILLTVDERYYEEAPDLLMNGLIYADVEVIKVRAFGITRPRMIGDIGLRAFPFLYREALRLIAIRKIDFIWIPIPSFYISLLGRLLYRKTKIPYGIDYIDPWIRDISNRKNMRSVLSNISARILEPFALKKASLISGVSELYYKPALTKYFKNRQVTHIAMPYGFDLRDHQYVLRNSILPWSDDDGSMKHYVYAGAFLPKSHLFIQSLFDAIRCYIDRSDTERNVRFYFIGTGSYSGKKISDYAEEAGISAYVIEDRTRRPFIEILDILSKSDGVLVIGSTEAHYTASKVFQAILSNKQIISILHALSSANEVLKTSGTDRFSIKYSDDQSRARLTEVILEKLSAFLKEQKNWHVDMEALDKYSSANSARLLAEKIEKAISYSNI